MTPQEAVELLCEQERFYSHAELMKALPALRKVIEDQQREVERLRSVLRNVAHDCRVIAYGVPEDGEINQDMLRMADALFAGVKP